MRLLLPLLALFSLPLSAREVVSLIDPVKIGNVWSFNNGAEFPGATGGVKLDESVLREGRPSLKLTGDFTKGGLYVLTGRKLDNIDIQQLDFWIKAPGFDRLVLRINDASKQTHQINVRVEPGGDWQHVVLPLERFFARRGQADAPVNISKYEYWGGAKDGKWHGPATDLYVLAPKGEKNEVKELWLSDIAITPPPQAAEVRQVIALDDAREGKPLWNFTNGPEFKGATGSLEATGGGLKLAGDFTAGGAYVAMVRNLGEADAKDVSAIRLRVKSENAESIGIQLVDATGQTHQRKGSKITADGAWHDFEIVPARIAGGEHWGGANDGKWHGPPRMISLSLTASSDEAGKKPVIHYSDVRLDAVREVFAKPPAFTADFTPAGFPDGWKTEGTVTADPANPFQGAPSLKLSRPLDSLPRPASATSPEFALSPGDWQIGGAFRPELESPDNSYHAAVVLECLDASGAPVDRLLLAELTKTGAWSEVKKVVGVPKGSTRGRFRISFQKTWGDLRVAGLSAAYLAPSKVSAQTVSRVLFSTQRLGNLLFPQDPRLVKFEVESAKELPADQREAAFVVRDYWGSEHTAPVTVKFGQAVKKDGVFSYPGTLDLAAAPLETGRYYEIHASVPQEGEPFGAFTSLAILPEAPNRGHKAEEVPFTSRNWDNRIPEYIRLSDRLGVRVCGLWGNWSSKPPYKPELPGLELCRELGMGWLTTTPAKFIEAGKTDYDEQALRQGARNFIGTYGKERPLIINLGNEPHGKGERVRKNVEAYRVIYDEIKKTDPTIYVVATSVEPNEEYFQNGYGKYCDAFDFHIYETPESIRKTMRHYRELMKKYDCEKPLWSTELGLNSQGQTRLVVATEVVKKVSSFFAEGGANMSWFGLLYPDPEGKDFGSSGDSHNVFDCRFRRYAPRLDAIAYYNMVNGVGIKKFTDEKHYADGVHAFLFRDRENRVMQVLWKDRGRQDVAIPLAGVGDVTAIRIDGRLRQLDAAATSISVGVSTDPLVLLYQGGPDKLPEELGTPALAIENAPATLSRAGSTVLTVSSGSSPAEDIGLAAPPFWSVEKSVAGKSVQFKVRPPIGSRVREADLTVTLASGKKAPRAELGLRATVAE